MTFTQTSRGAVAFVRMFAVPGTGPTTVHLQDGVTIRPDALGGYNVRSSDVQSLIAVGLSIGTGLPGSATDGASSIAQFQASVLTGQGAGTAT